MRTLFSDPDAFDVWHTRWRKRLTKEAVPPGERTAQMLRVNPAVIPRNHLVEEVLRAATEQQDFQAFEDLLDVLARPYEDGPRPHRYMMPARPEECVRQTFCGT